MRPRRTDRRAREEYQIFLACPSRHEHPFERGCINMKLRCSTRINTRLCVLYMSLVAGCATIDEPDGQPGAAARGVDASSAQANKAHPTRRRRRSRTHRHDTRPGVIPTPAAGVSWAFPKTTNIPQLLARRKTTHDLIRCKTRANTGVRQRRSDTAARERQPHLQRDTGPSSKAHERSEAPASTSLKARPAWLHGAPVQVRDFVNSICNKCRTHPS